MTKTWWAAALVLAVVGSGCRGLTRSADEVAEGILDGARRTDVPDVRLPDLPRTTWTPPQRFVAKATKLGAEGALEAGLEAGVTMSDTDPDLSGDWRQEDDWNDGLRATMDIHRTREAPGLYAFAIDIQVKLEATPFLKLHITGFEVIGANLQCQYATETSIAFASPEIEKLMMSDLSQFTPDIQNEDPCGRVGTLTADRVEGIGGEDDTFVEKRVR